MLDKPFLTIGLTGGIGSGKSTAVALFKELGAGIIDCDKIAHDLVNKDAPAYHAIIAHFSDAILDPENNTIDRAKLRQMIFNHPEEKIWLESCLHPLIRQEIKKQLEDFSKSSIIPYVIIDIPLLNNRKDFPYLNRILVIDCPEALQIEHICARSGLSESLAKQMIDAQISRQKRNILADDLIMNDKSIDELRESVRRLHEQYIKNK